MSFGVGVGDFIAVIKIAKKLRDDFQDAPAQLKDISNEYVHLPNRLYIVAHRDEPLFGSLAMLYLVIHRYRRGIVIDLWEVPRRSRFEFLFIKPLSRQ